MAKPFVDSELLVMVAERLRPTASFTAHGYGDQPETGVLACVGDVKARGATYEAAVAALGARLVDRLAAQIDHDTQLMRRLVDALASSNE